MITDFILQIQQNEDILSNTNKVFLTSLFIKFKSLGRIKKDDGLEDKGI